MDVDEDEEYHYDEDYDDQGDGENDYGGDEDGNDDGDKKNKEENLPIAIRIENTFYEAEDNKISDPQLSLELFRKVIALEEEQSNSSSQSSNVNVQWRFKSLEQIVLILFKLGMYQEMVSSYRMLLSLNEKVTRNQISEATNRILDTISTRKITSSSNAGNNNSKTPSVSAILREMFEVTIESLKEAKNEGLWFNTNLKLGRMYLESKDYKNLERLCDELHASITAAGSGHTLSQKPQDMSVSSVGGNQSSFRGTHRLEVYALEISMYSATKQKRKLKEAYSKSKQLDSALKDPRIMGSIHEAGGMMYMEEGSWQKAYDELFDGFRAYQEAANPRAKHCLKLVALVNMIVLSKISPFDSREAKVYKDDPEIQAMMQLRAAYETLDAKQFEKILNDPKNKIADDPVILNFTKELLDKIRSQVCIHIIAPYSRVKLDYLAKEIGVTESECENIVVDLILDEKLDGLVDPVKKIYEAATGSRNEMKDKSTTAQEKKNNDALNQWITSLQKIKASFDRVSADNIPTY